MMKISEEVTAKVNQRKVMPHNKSERRFGEIVQAKSMDLVRKKLVDRVEEIKKQGEKVARFRSFRDLAKFKRMITQFLQETVYDGLSVRETYNFNSRNDHHKFITVEKIDEKLVQLTEDLLDEEKRTIDLLGLIGEIEGLLVNIYT